MGDLQEDLSGPDSPSDGVGNYISAGGATEDIELDCVRHGGKLGVGKKEKEMLVGPTPESGNLEDPFL